MAIGTTLQNVKDNLGITNFNNDLMSYSGSAAGSNQNNGWQYYDGYTGTTVLPMHLFHPWYLQKVIIFILQQTTRSALKEH